MLLLMVGPLIFTELLSNLAIPYVSIKWEPWRAIKFKVLSSQDTH